MIGGSRRRNDVIFPPPEKIHRQSSYNAYDMGSDGRSGPVRATHIRVPEEQKNNSVRSEKKIMQPQHTNVYLRTRQAASANKPPPYGQSKGQPGGTPNLTVSQFDSDAMSYDPIRSNSIDM